MNKPLFPVVILAGGLGTRLAPITQTIPKVLVNVNGEPFIAHQLRYLRKQNISSIVLCLGYLGEMIQEFLAQKEWGDLNITYSFDGKQLLGTAGSIKKALPFLPETFFVLYGDSYLPCDFSNVQESFIQQNKTALMTVFKNNGQFDKSNIVFQNNNILTYDKKNHTPHMNYIDYGLGIFQKKAFEAIGNESYDLATLYQKLLNQQELAACEINARFYEVGSFSGIKDLATFLTNNS